MKKLLPPADSHNSTGYEIEPVYVVEGEKYHPVETGYYDINKPAGERDVFRNIFSTLRNHWFLILLLNISATTAAIVYMAQKPDYYEATARVQVNAENNPAAGARDGSGTIVVGGSDPVYFTTQLQILEGAGLLRRVVKTLDLENNQNFLDPQRGRQLTVFQNVQKMFGIYKNPVSKTEFAVQSANENRLRLKPENSAADPDAETEKYAPLVNRIKSDLTVMPVKDSRTSNRETRLIEISFSHQDPAVAAKVVNAIGDAYVLHNLEQKIQTNASAGDFLQKRVADLQAEIRQGEERLMNYSKSNQIVSLDASQNTVVQRFGDSNLKLGQAQNDRIAAETAYQAAVQNQMRAATAEGKDAQVAGMEGKLNDLRQKLAQLKTQYTDEWFEVVETKKQIESIENQLGGLRKRASDIQLAGLAERLAEATAREKQLSEVFEQQRADVMRQNEASINYKIIQQEIATNKNLLDGLLQRSRENDVILNGTPNNVLVAERALVPDSPIGPGRAKYVMLAFIFSLFAGGGLAFLLDWANDSVKNSEDMETALGMPLLATIPAAPLTLTSRLLPKKLSLRRRWKRSGEDYNSEVFDRPEFSESYQQLGTRLMFSPDGEPAPRVILVTSAEEGEGKTLTALNLAQSLAKTGERILLIDADLRCPRLHLIKEIQNEKGLTTLLGVDEINDEYISLAVQKKEGENLYFMTSGETSLSPTNLLCSEQMRVLLKKLRGQFSRVIIDSPPALYFADSMMLSTLADSVVVVARDNFSSRQLILKTKKLLQSVGAKIAGVIINGVALEWTSRYKYRNYNSRTGFSSSSPDGLQTLNL